MPIIAKADALVFDPETDVFERDPTVLRFIVEQDEIEFGFNRAFQSNITLENLASGADTRLLSAFAEGTGDDADDIIYAGLIPEQRTGEAYFILLQGDELEAPRNREDIEPYFARLGFQSLTVDFGTEMPLNTAFTVGTTRPLTDFDGVVSLGEIGPDVLEQRAQFIALLYEAGLDRDGDIDEGGLNFWIDQAGNGFSNRQLANAFIQSREFEASFGAPETLSDDEFVRQLYRNVLDREADDPGFDFWSGILAESGGRRDELLIAFAASAENRDGSPLVASLEETDPGIWEFG